jgi:nucleotide-binding universal stress UspA family protein
LFERIVLAVDDWDQARGALAAAIDLAAKSRGEVLIVHVHDIGLVSRETVDLKTQSEPRRLTEAAVEVLTRKGAEARDRLEVAKSAGVAREILHAARDFGADTIVLGSRRLGGFAGLPLGSVAHRVIQQADCPVVVVRVVAATAATGDSQSGTATAA